MPDLALRRNIGGGESRTTRAGSLELREAGGSSATLTGYASVTEVPYTVTDWLGDYTEIIRSGAFQKSVKEADVRLLLNHDGLPLARTKSGTLALREVMDGADDPQGDGQTGLWVEADLDATSSLVRDVRSAMQRGDLDEMSFAFQVTKQEWSPDFTQRDIHELRVFDVSVVTYPANPATSASIRSLDALVRDLTDDQAREALERLQRRLAPQTPANVVRWYELDRDAVELGHTA